eukprot:8072104-Heterocapsa_arctica.AAC.1
MSAAHRDTSRSNKVHRARSLGSLGDIAEDPLNLPPATPRGPPPAANLEEDPPAPEALPMPQCL